LKILFALLSAVVVVACAPPFRGAAQQSADERSIAALRLAPHQVSIHGHLLRLDAEAGLNLMPGAVALPGPPRSPVHILLWLSSADSALISSDLQLDSVYVLHGDSAWRESPRVDQTDRLARGRGTVVRRLDDGPLWAYGADSLDIVLRLVDGSTGASVLVRAPRVALHRSY
jgi:hypothetical protein